MDCKHDGGWHGQGSSFCDHCGFCGRCQGTGFSVMSGRQCKPCQGTGNEALDRTRTRPAGTSMVELFTNQPTPAALVREAERILKDG